MIEEHCVYCGAEIVKISGSSHHQIYCGKECARLAANDRKREQLRERKAAARAAKRAPGEQALDFCMKEAERLGISYGQYMARRADL